MNVVLLMSFTAFQIKKCFTVVSANIKLSKSDVTITEIKFEIENIKFVITCLYEPPSTLQHKIVLILF